MYFKKFKRKKKLANWAIPLWAWPLVHLTKPYEISPPHPELMNKRSPRKHCHIIYLPERINSSCCRFFFWNEKMLLDAPVFCHWDLYYCRLSPEGTANYIILVKY